jgi:hypothetical protein
MSKSGGRSRKIFIYGGILLLGVAFGFWVVNRQLKEIELEAMRRDIFVTAQIGTADEVREMLDAGLDPNTLERSSFEEEPTSWWERLGFGTKKWTFYPPRISRRSILDCAVQNQKHRYEMVKLLLDRGAKLRGTKEFPMTPLWAAAGVGDLETTKLLLAHGADVNDGVVSSDMPYSETPLMGAVNSARTETVRVLLENGATVTGKEIISKGYARYGMPDPREKDVREIEAMLAKAREAQRKRPTRP